jgi:hypothetical protein
MAEHQRQHVSYPPEGEEMEEKDIPKGAILTPLNKLRWKKQAKGGPVLQQRFHIEGAKTVFYLWRDLPVVKDAPN